MGLLLEERAQVSIEYLLSAMFGILLALAAAMLIEAIRGISLSARAEILNQREQTLSSIIGEA
jgi:uncharacterized protein (UPF0333 family)